MRPVLIGTAGHIDHGKTSLVRALTGVDLDRTPEERARGITIELGVCPLELGDGRRVAFVDVPGHERLVRTMVAGAWGLDAALLVVSAEEGVMPQTREHLAILDLLGVVEGAVVLTKADRVDDDLLALARDDVADLVAGTAFADKPILPFSAVTGLGRDALLAQIAAWTAQPRPARGPFRLAVDRAFSRPGFGTVVSGTTQGAPLRDGDRVVVWPEGRAARVRGLHQHGVAVVEAEAGVRAAINLAGVEVEDVSRGAVVAGGDVPCASVLDAWVRVTSRTLRLRDGDAVRVLAGTSERTGRVHGLGPGDGLGEGAEAAVQLRLDAPLPCLPGDRFVLRRVSPVDTLGGGVILDPWAPRVRDRDLSAWRAEVERLRAGDEVVALERAGPAGLAVEAWAARRALTGAADAPDPGVIWGDRVLAPTVAAEVRASLTAALDAWHVAHPLRPGAPRAEVRVGPCRALTSRAWDALCEEGPWEIDGPMLRAPGFVVRLADAEERALQACVARVAEAGLEGLDWEAIKAGAPRARGAVSIDDLVGVAVGRGLLVAVPDVGFVSAAAIDQLHRWLDAFFAAHDALAPAHLKEGLGLTRRTSVPWLTWLDRAGWTRRVGDARAVGPAWRPASRGERG
jgi:selenocysteine-specific elongation factor